MALVESSIGTTSNTGVIIDASGCPWSLVPSGAGLQVMIRGTIDTTTANVSQLLYWNHGIYQQTAGQWFKRQSQKWVATHDPRTVQSANGATITTPGMAIVDSTLGTWALIGGQIAHNGTVDTATGNVALLLYWNKVVYQENSSHLWWYWNGTGWTAAIGDPRVASESPSGTTVAASTGSIIDSAGTKWTLVSSATAGMQAARNTTVDTTTANITLLLYWSHLVYQQNSAGGWWYWNSGWVGSTDPRIVPTTGDVTVNFANQTGSTVSKYLYGFSTGPLQDGDGGSFAIAANPAFIASAAKLRPTLIRFNITASIVQSFNNGNTSVMNSFWDNYQKFCDPQVRLVMGVPGGNDTSISPQTCAQWAANFAKMMKGQGHEIMYWEVGNELDGLGPNAYASYFNPIADALHAVNPDYLVGGPVASWWNGIDLGTFASLSGSRCGFINFHSYSANPGTVPSYASAMGGSAVLAARNQVNNTALAHLPIGMLEYNMINVPDSSSAGATQAQIYGAVWTALLLMACVTQETAAHSGDLMCALWDIVNDSNYGVIGNQFNGGSGNYTTITPQGWYLGYAGQHMAGSMVAAVTTKSNLQVMATVNGGHFAVQLINYSTSTSQTLNIATSGLALPASITRWELSAANPNTTISTLANLTGVVVPAQSIVIVSG